MKPEIRLWKKEIFCEYWQTQHHNKGGVIKCIKNMIVIM